MHQYEIQPHRCDKTGTHVLFASPLQNANARPGSLAVPVPIIASKSSLPRWYLLTGHQTKHQRMKMAHASFVHVLVENGD
jgi:hypothetical protein